MGKNQNKGELKRDLRLIDAIGIGLGAIIGAGIFVVTGVAAGVAGPSFLIGLVVAGVVATFNALSSAQLAATYPQSGGTYEYGYQVLHPSLGFAAGWVFLVSKLAAAGTVALGFAGYFTALFPVASERIIAVIAAVILRSEEHTSELQSPCNLVCRLLLEKKKTHDSTLACLSLPRTQRSLYRTNCRADPC